MSKSLFFIYICLPLNLFKVARISRSGTRAFPSVESKGSKKLKTAWRAGCLDSGFVSLVSA